MKVMKFAAGRISNNARMRINAIVLGTLLLTLVNDAVRPQTTNDRHWQICYDGSAGSADVIDACSHVIKISPKGANRQILAYWQRGHIHLQGRDYEAAIADFSSYLRFLPSSTERKSLDKNFTGPAYLRRALAYFGAEKYDQAKKDLDSADRFVGVVPGSATAELRADIAMALKDYAAADKLYERAQFAVGLRVTMANTPDKRREAELAELSFMEKWRAAGSMLVNPSGPVPTVPAPVGPNSIGCVMFPNLC